MKRALFFAIAGPESFFRYRGTGIMTVKSFTGVAVTGVLNVNTYRYYYFDHLV